MANLEKNIEEKLTEVFKGEFEKEDFELNYLITDDVITFFFPIAEGKELSLDSIEKISSIIDARFEGSNIVNQEYRYAFNLDPCAD
ncbi:hypothetical protein [Methanobrevibacter sp.]|jgi:hypothetical protein|uniref:hypothetical protein n=1 Tax=Methanobrevibacter sp. TaxID=66852 RepID=UPI002622DB5A|nr:hypothetical protein [uncultured Methanobrevibacter sp.]